MPTTSPHPLSTKGSCSGIHSNPSQYYATRPNSLQANWESVFSVRRTRAEFTRRAGRAARPRRLRPVFSRADMLTVTGILPAAWVFTKRDPRQEVPLPRRWERDVQKPWPRFAGAPSPASNHLGSMDWGHRGFVVFLGPMLAPRCPRATVTSCLSHSPFH